MNNGSQSKGLCEFFEIVHLGQITKLGLVSFIAAGGVNNQRSFQMSLLD